MNGYFVISVTWEYNLVQGLIVSELALSVLIVEMGLFYFY